MTRRAILHIGTEKTGTTSIQRALATARDNLVQNGFLYPVLGPADAHAALVLYASGAPADERIDLCALAGIPVDMPIRELRRAVEKRLADQIARHPDATVVLSTEHASSRLLTYVEVRRLHRLLSRHFDEIRIVCYLRRWDRFAISFHSTYVQMGGVLPFAFDLAPVERLDYLDLLRRWSRIFGDQAVDVAVYESAKGSEGGVVSDFARRAGLPPIVAEAWQNEALNHESMRAMQAVSQAYGARAEESAIIRAAIAQISSGETRPQPLIDADSARRFVALRDGEAERIRAEFLPDRERLFDDSYVEYDGYPVDAAIDDAIDDRDNWRATAMVLSEAILATWAKLNRVTAEAAYHRAKIHYTHARLPIAKREIVNAIALDRQPTYLHLLALIELLDGDRAAALAAIDQALLLEPDNLDFTAMRVTLA